MQQARSLYAQALSDLALAADDFVALDAQHWERYEHLHHAALSALHAICAAIVACEDSGCTREDIVGVLGSVREIHARSPFVARLQRWPRGYPGDFETVESICTGENTAPEATLERHCEAYSLNFPIAQQHRNKVWHQARQIADAVLQNGRARILALACGGCPDVRKCLTLLRRTEAELHLNDADADALAFAARQLAPIADRCTFLPGNALKVARRLRGGQTFDLILAGGLFDYLPDRHAGYLLEQAYAQLAPGGVLFFTNIAAGNPWRPLIEYVGDWFLLERSAADLRTLTDAAGIVAEAVNIGRDETGLAFLIEITKLASLKIDS
jgi:extracellular factor (EF) 3-hydroxypalmitic acid methyl ester biosynthesis protein